MTLAILSVVIALVGAGICIKLEAIGEAIRESGQRIERCPVPANGDPFGQAHRALLGRRWNTREADALAELVEMGRELP